MQRVHRSIRRRSKSINPTRTADSAEEYLEGLKLFKKELNGVTGMVTPTTIKNSIKRIDDLEKEMIRLDNRIAKLEERRAIEAAKLELDLKHNNSVLKDYLSRGELKEFWG